MATDLCAFGFRSSCRKYCSTGVRNSSNKLPRLVSVIYIFLADVNNKMSTLNSHFSRKEVFAAFRRYSFRSTFTHSYVCGTLLIEVLLNNLPPSVVSGTCLEAEARVSGIHDFLL